LILFGATPTNAGRAKEMMIFGQLGAASDSL
jgi:hypothetical protein